MSDDKGERQKVRVSIVMKQDKTVGRNAKHINGEKATENIALELSGKGNAGRIQSKGGEAKNLTRGVSIEMVGLLILATLAT